MLELKVSVYGVLRMDVLVVRLNKDQERLFFDQICLEIRGVSIYVLYRLTQGERSRSAYGSVPEAWLMKLKLLNESGLYGDP